MRMIKAIFNKKILIIVALFQLGVSACSSRFEAPVHTEGSTLVFPAKDPDGISAEIALFRKVDKKSGNNLGEGRVFSIREKANIRALINIDNRDRFPEQALIFHIDWVDANGKSIHRKKIDLDVKDSSSTIKSSISISPEKRKPGEYAIRLYYFRELIAEKKFKILPVLWFERDLEDGLNANITLYRKKSKKTGELVGKGKGFKIKHEAKVRALVELNDRYAYGKQELAFHCRWFGPNNKTIFSKNFDLFPEDSSNIINSSISIHPGKREPGEYRFQVYLFEHLIAEQEFVLF